MLSHERELEPQVICDRGTGEEIFNGREEREFRQRVCSVVVSRSLCMRKAPGSIPGRSITF